MEGIKSINNTISFLTFSLPQHFQYILWLYGIESVLGGLLILEHIKVRLPDGAPLEGVIIGFALSFLITTKVPIFVQRRWKVLPCALHVMCFASTPCLGFKPVM